MLVYRTAALLCLSQNIRAALLTTFTYLPGHMFSVTGRRVITSALLWKTLQNLGNKEIPSEFLPIRMRLLKSLGPQNYTP